MVIAVTNSSFVRIRKPQPHRGRNCGVVAKILVCVLGALVNSLGRVGQVNFPQLSQIFSVEV